VGWAEPGPMPAGTEAGISRFAERLSRHPNTVRYRLQRIEKRTGLSLSRPRDVAELWLGSRSTAAHPTANTLRLGSSGAGVGHSQLGCHEPKGVNGYLYSPGVFDISIISVTPL
jgi:PucR C-terminal helix-turn-helix domain